MKRLIVIGFGLLGSATEIVRSAEHEMRFLNGDMIAGSLKELGPEEILWDSPHLEETAVFRTEQAYSLMLPDYPPQRPESSHEAEITMTNGDVLHGQLAEVTADHVLLDTWYAGQLKLNRLMVESVTVDDIGKLLYRGPDQIDGWTVTPDADAWVYETFSLRSKGAGAIARNDVLADECSVGFDLEWDASYVNFSTILFSDPVTSKTPQTGYNVAFQGSSVTLRSLSSRDYIGNVQVRELRTSNRVKIEIQASRLTGRVVLLVDQKVCAVWQDNQLDKAMLKDGIHFIADTDSNLRISNIRIAEWDGEIDGDVPPPAQMGMRGFRGFMPEGFDGASEPEKEEEETEPRMKLANGDSIVGKVTSIHEGQVEIESALGLIKIPVHRLRSILLPPAPREEPKRENADIRCTMADGGSMVFELLSADQESIKARSQNFGTAVFRRDAFQRIDFNIHMPEFQMMRKISEEWTE